MTLCSERDELFGVCPSCGETYFSEWKRTGCDASLGTHRCTICGAWLSPGIPTRLMATGAEVSKEVIEEITHWDCDERRKYDPKHMDYLLTFITQEDVSKFLAGCADCTKEALCIIRESIDDSQGE